MKRIPKYKTLPTIMFVYFIVMSIYSFKLNDWKQPDNFWVMCFTEIVIIVILYFSLKYLYKKRNDSMKE